MGPIAFNIILALIVSWVTWKAFTLNHKFKWLVASVFPLLLPLIIYTPIWLNTTDTSDAWVAFMGVIGVAFCYVGSIVGLIGTLIKPNEKT